MTAVSPYAPTRRNAFLHHDPVQQQQRSTRRRRRTATSLALLMLMIEFWDSPAMQRVLQLLRMDNFLNHDTTRRLMDSEWGQLVRRRGSDVWDLISRMLGAIMTQLRMYARLPSAAGDTSTSAETSATRENEPNTASHKVKTARMNGTTGANTNGEMSGAASQLATVVENQKLIHSILCYWFGQYSPDNSQKKLWMIASSSEDQRRRVDAEITEKFEAVVLELSHVDDEAESRGKCEAWCTDTELYGYAGKVAAIVALDQFSRHIRRHYDSSSSAEKECHIPSQKILDSLAYQTAQRFTKQHKDEIECGMVPLPMHVFALMPYRHASTLWSVRYVQECVERCAAMEEQMDGMIGRFRKATNRRMAILQDEARRTGVDNNENADEGFEGDESVESTAASTNCSAEDSSHEKVYRDEDILETFPFEVDMSSAQNHPVHRTIRAFLAGRGIHPHEKIKHGDEFVEQPVIVSLSGGVDSMVIAAVLSHLAKECGYNLNIVAIHIDYANRPESGAEANYVHKFCDRLGIAFKCRRIDEVTRGVTARDEYERIAREARYISYRQTVEECLKFVSDAENVQVGVMLGHHLGDLRENVLSNAHKGCGPLDLSGMIPVSQNDGVLIYRPLLPLEKKDVYDYAHKFGIPYFKDTTPHWSTRGKLRNKLLPLLQEIYGDGCMDNLSTLAAESDEARDLLYQTVLSPFLNQVHHRPMGITFDTAPWKTQGFFFWKFVLREALHSAGLGMFSDKSVVSFLERVQVEIVRAGWLQCRRDYAVYLQEDGRVFVLYPDSFPFRKADQYQCVGQVVPFDKDNATCVGPWKITADLISASVVSTEAEANLLLKEKAISSMDQFMDGCLHYYVKAPICDEVQGSSGEIEDGTPRPLVFVSEYSRQSRPQAWKKGDMKIQATLPLLGNDEDAAKALSDASIYGSEWRLAKVMMSRSNAHES